MATLKPKQMPDAGSVDTALAAADAAGDIIDGHAYLALVRNASAGAITVTVHRPGDTNQTVSVPAGGIHLIRVASANRLTYSAVASVTVGFFSV